METELAKINETILKEHAKNIRSACINIDFLSSAQFYLLFNRLEFGEPIEFSEVTESGRELLYNFICATIEMITINPHDVGTLTFTNGLMQPFVKRP